MTTARQMGPWFRWFAWRPVDTADRGVRWLRFVWRRRLVSEDGPTVLWFESRCEDPRGRRESARDVL